MSNRLRISMLPALLCTCALALGCGEGSSADAPGAAATGGAAGDGGPEAGGAAGTGGTAGSGGAAGVGGTAGAFGGGGSGGSGGAAGVGGTGGTGAAGGAAGTGGDGGGGAAGSGGDPAIVPAVTACSSPTSACGASADGTTYASYRKDYYYPDSLYNEYTSSPTTGGRFHIALVSPVDGVVTGVVVDGFDTSQLATANEPPVEWLHVWPHQVKAGEPFFVQFHSKDAKWDAKATGTLKVQTTGGVAFDGTFPVSQTLLPITHVTTTPDYATLLFHIKNYDTQPHTIAKIVVDGRDVTSATCIPSTTIDPGASALFELDLCQAAGPGDAYTVVVTYADAPTAVGVGRILPPRYPIVTWNNTSDCPYPGVIQDNFDKHIAAGIDTLFLNGAPSGCSYAQDDIVAMAATDARFDLVVSSDYGLAHTIPDVSGIATFMTGDESDGDVYDSDSGVSIPHVKAAKVSALWDKYPTVPTYNGAKTNGNVGAFAGTDDIQGMDFYIAACAPHITAWGQHPPPRASYDYLVNARNNHMPLPTWLYAQGLSPVTAWKKQPAPQEILVQAMSVVAAGGKGLMWFQSNMDKAEAFPASWNAMSAIGRMVHGVRSFLREGDITGMASSAPDVIVDAVRSREALVVPVIDVATTGGPTDVLCGIYVVTPWSFASVAPNVSVTVPKDFAVRDVFEVGASSPIDYDDYQVNGRTLTLGPVSLDNATPVRLFVLARDASVRAKVATAMAY